MFPIPRNGGAGELLSTCSFRVSGWDWAVVRVLLAGLAVLVQYVSNANLNLIEKEDYVTAADTAQKGDSTKLGRQWGKSWIFPFSWSLFIHFAGFFCFWWCN